MLVTTQVDIVTVKVAVAVKIVYRSIVAVTTAEWVPTVPALFVQI